MYVYSHASDKDCLPFRVNAIVHGCVFLTVIVILGIRTQGGLLLFIIKQYYLLLS